jgi:glycosyltransferase involved in cell wall biosynthesis
MKIDTLVSYFHPVTGGVETRIREMGSRLVERGHEVTVHTAAVTPKGERLPATDQLRGIKISRHKPRWRLGYFLLDYAPRRIDGDLLDLQGYPHLSGDLLARRTRVPYVITPHGLTLTTKGAARQSLRRAYDRLYGTRTLQGARKIIGMTGDEKAWLDSRHVRTPFEEIPSGLDDQAFEAGDAEAFKKKHGLGRFVLFLARLHPEKAPDHLLLAFSQVAARHPDVSLVFMGPDGGALEALKERAATLSLTARIVVTGPVAEPEKRAALAGCDFLALPSQFEALGVVFLEAWAQGKPVVASSVGGVPYLVEEGRTGLLHPFGDVRKLAIILDRLLADGSERRRMGDAARRRALEFKWEPLTDRLEKALKAAAARP